MDSLVVRRPKNPSLVLALVLALCLVARVSAVNDPGHDSLYVVKLGDSNVTGTINLSGTLNATNIRVATLLYGDQLDIRANGTILTASSRPALQADANDLYLDAKTNLYLNTKGGTTNIVQVGPTTGSSIIFNVSGAITQQGIAICLANGSNCPVISGASSAGGWANDSTTTRTSLMAIVNSSSLTGSFLVQNASGSSHLFVNGSSGIVGIGTGSPTAALHIAPSMNRTALRVTGWANSGGNTEPVVDIAGTWDTSNNVDAVLITMNSTSCGTDCAFFNIRAGTDLKSKLAVRKDGYVGVNLGYGSPTSLFDVRSTDNSEGGIASTSANGSSFTAMLTYNGLSQFMWRSSDDIRFGTSSTIASGSFTEVMRLTSGLRVGIGTTVPTHLLTVNGTTNLSGATYLGNSKCSGAQVLTTDSVSGLISCATPAGDGSGGWVNDSVATRTQLRVVVNNSNGTGGSLLVQNTSGSAHLFVNGTSGFAGHGTTSPYALLDVLSEDNNVTGLVNVLALTHTIQNSSNGSAGISAGLLFRTDNQMNVTTNVSAIVGNLTTSTNGSEAGALLFMTRTAGAALTEQMRIDGSGKAGIGMVPITGDAAKLQLTGTMNVTAGNVSVQSGNGICFTEDCTSRMYYNGTALVIQG